VTADPDLDALRRSPAAHLGDLMAGTGSPASVQLSELPFRYQYEVSGADVRARNERGGGDQKVPADGPEPGRALGEGPRYVLWLGPDWHLVVDDAPVPDLPAGAVDVSAQRTVLELSGPLVRAVLAHGCSLDLHPRAFGPGSCAQTMLAKAQVVLHQTEPETYRILVRPSFTDYLVRWLLDAMTEYVSETAGADP
jgi:sarcosine oxidase, subunit gamma